METIVYAELKVSGCYAALWLNGIPLLSTGRFGANFTQMAVRQFLVKGNNRLELLIEPLPKPSAARWEQRKLTLASGWAAGRLVRYEDGVPALVENGTILHEHHWAADGREDTYPKIFSADVPVPDARTTWDWESAPVLALGPDLTREAVTVLEAVAEAIRRNDLDAFMSLTEAKLRDVQTAYPVRTPDATRDELREFLAFWAGVGDPILPLDGDAHDFRLAAGGRLLETVDEDGLASLRFRDPSDGAAIPYALYLGRVNDRLVVMR